MHWIWRESLNRVEVLLKRVHEERDVLAASEFARWLEFSGIIRLLERHSQDGPLKVDAAMLRGKCHDLQKACNSILAGTGSGRLGPDSIRSLHEKLDLIAGHLSRVSLHADGLRAGRPEAALPCPNLVNS